MKAFFKKIAQKLPSRKQFIPKKRQRSNAANETLSAEDLANIRQSEHLAGIPLPRGLTKEYLITKMLGRGAFSSVFQIREHSTGALFALKIIRKKLIMERKMDEIYALRRVDHPYIVKLYKFLESTDYIFLVLEYAAGAELFESLVTNGVFSEYESKVLMKKILEAVKHLHVNCNIVHRDLKPENILLSHPVGSRDIDMITPKICDFGISKSFNSRDERARSLVGSNGWTAPEIISGLPYDHSVDIWSLGVFLFAMLCGENPFQDSNINVMVQKTLRSKIEFFADIDELFSENAKDLITKMTNPNPGLRPTAAECLQHPFFK